MSDFELEHRFRIWDNRHGSFVEVCDDSDGLGLIDIRSHNDHGKELACITLEQQQAELLVKALSKYLAALRTQQEVPNDKL